jgi:ferritin-like metal-binding protein YciE
MPTKISNPRDLLLQLLGELLFVERRLAGGVLRDLAGAVRDEELRLALRRHLDETQHHVERLEIAFRRLDAAPSSVLSRPFESAVAQHDELAPSVVEPGLADQFHAQAALHTEHWELAAYDALLRLAAPEVGDLLRPSRDEEEAARQTLEGSLARLARDADAR